VAYNLTQEVVAALLVRGVQPTVEEAEASDEDDILRFAGSETYLSVSSTEIWWNERMQVGGNVLVSSWALENGDIPRFVAEVVHEFWQECGAAISTAYRAQGSR